ncbi:MAG: phage holin family protein [Rhodoferax sp.]
MNDLPNASAFETAKAKAATLLALGHTRLELLGNELEIGGRTALRQLMLAQALLFGAGLGIVLTVIALALLFWEQRLLVVALAAGLAWALTAYCYLALRQRTRKPEPLFAASLAELQEDLRQLRAAKGHGPETD